MEQRFVRHAIFKVVLFFYVVAVCFQNLLILPGVGNKIQLPELVFPFLFLFFPYSILSTVRFSKRQRTLGFALVALLLTQVVSFAVTGNGLMEVAGKFYLFLLFILLVFYFTFLSKTELVSFVSNSFFIMGSVLAVVSLVGYFMALGGVENRFVYRIDDYPYFGTILRLCGPTFTPSMIITLLSCSILFSVANDRFIALSRAGKNFLLFLMGIACMLTFSKSILILGLCLFIFFFSKRYRLTRRVLFGSIAAVVLAVSISTHVLVVPDTKVEDANFGSTPFTSNKQVMAIGQYKMIETTYLTLKRTAFAAFVQNPIFGIGPGAFNLYVEQQKREGKFPAKIPSYDPHSTYTGAMAETGAIGFLALLLFFCLLWREYGQIRLLQMDSFRLSIFLLLLFFLIEGISTDIMNFRHLWIVFAIAFVYFNKK